MLMASWIGALSYTFQIYFDFSGYSDMALGLGHLFNLELPVNFDAPYKSRNIVEFWRRWHMTLSRFLKEYLYIPLGGNRKGTFRRYINLMATMLLGGLWHGAAWTFVFWGGLHGLYLCIVHFWGKVSKKIGVTLPLPVAWLITFVATVFAWVFFKAEDFGKAVSISEGMLGLNGMETLDSVLWATEGNTLASWLPINEKIAVIAALTLVCLFFPVSWRWVRTKMEKYATVSAVVAALLFLLSVLGLTRISEFLYFQF
jgi:alginate O-acetyltransferase complex protein AlgI